ncbi:MAG: DUF418 domain-containing protein [Pseudonocardia sp.]|nr:DUF418 domain-containing protein [Pseudonocardia sp.]
MISTPADPGATPATARALAPDLARGGMLLLIALANVHLYVYGRPLSARGYPVDMDAVEQAVALVQALLVDGRAYPLFGFLFGYGIVQLAWRRAALGLPAEAVSKLVRRRGAWMIAIGFGHGVLLWAGDIVGAYGLLAVLMAGLLVRGSDRALLVTAGIGVSIITVLYALTGLVRLDGQRAFLPSVLIPDAGPAALARLFEWIGYGLLTQAVGVFASVALGAWAARRRLLDEPQRHHRMLVRVAVLGLFAAVLGGLPAALMTAQLWTSPPVLASVVAGALHAVGGYLGALGYAALFGLLAIRLARRTSAGPGTGPVSGALRACGQRSLSCYLAQSVAFGALLPAWSLGLGEGSRVWQTALVGLGAWAVILVIAAMSDRAGYRGPAELVLRRLTYGARSPQQV